MEKSIFNFKIQKQDNSTIDLHEHNLFVNSFRIISPNFEHVSENVDGRHGSIYFGTSLRERRISAKITIEGEDYIDFDLLRDKIYRIFNPLEKFYIIRDIQPAKRVEVSVASEFDIDYIWLELGEFQIDFVIHSPFFESIGTTLDPLTFDSGKWQVGQGLIADKLEYVHSKSIFKIYNAGDVEVDPRQLPLKIKFQGASNNLALRNESTGDTWIYYGSSGVNDTILLDGIRSLKNGTSIFKDTNKKLISLKQGWNDFTLLGGSGSFLISFDFRHYYL